MATARKLPSGNYRCRAYVGKDENGKNIYKSFTDPVKSKAEKAASEYILRHPIISTEDSFSIMAYKYIDYRKPVLSPSTIYGYQVYNKSISELFPSFCSMQINDIDSDDIQDIINCMVKKGFSSKTIRNKLSFVSSVINYSGNAVPSYRLPQRKRPELNIPDDTTMKQIFKIIKDTDMEIPVMLASFGAMRRGEICSLTMDDIKKNTVHVYKSIVRGPDNKLHIKPPKTFTSDRYIEFPDFVISKIKKQGYVTNMNPNTLSKRFSQMLKVNNIPHFRFHDLRHYAASSMHAAGIPDAYIMRVGGWSSTSVLDNVYRHALTDQQKEMSDKSIEHFKSLF